MKLGLITIGQAPRTDFTDDIIDLLPEGVDILQRGALDRFSREALPSIAPEPGDIILVTLLRDGSQATFAEKHILPLLQEAIDELEEVGCGVILLLCTGRFPPFRHNSLLIRPQELLLPMMNRIGAEGILGIVVPEEEQKVQFCRWWDLPEEKVRMVCASPYGGETALIQAAERLKREGINRVYLDCMGYTRGMKRLVAGITGTPVFLPRTFIVRILGEIFDT